MLMQELIDKISEKTGCSMKADITVKGPSDLLLHLTPADRENPRISDLTFRMHILSTHIKMKLESCAKDKNNIAEPVRTIAGEYFPGENYPEWHSIRLMPGKWKKTCEDCLTEYIRQLTGKQLEMIQNMAELNDVQNVQSDLMRATKKLYGIRNHMM